MKLYAVAIDGIMCHYAMDAATDGSTLAQKQYWTAPQFYIRQICRNMGCSIFHNRPIAETCHDRFSWAARFFYLFEINFGCKTEFICHYFTWLASIQFCWDKLSIYHNNVVKTVWTHSVYKKSVNVFCFNQFTPESNFWTVSIHFKINYYCKNSCHLHSSHF